MAKVCHITSCHQASDIRVFAKECATLAAAGHEVTLVAQGAPPADGKGVKFVQLPPYRRILGRFTFDLLFRMNYLCFREALRSRAEIVHFHDPHLLVVGFLLAAMGRQVVYDVHEYVPGLLRQAENMGSKGMRNLLAGAFEIFENTAARCLAAVICATPSIAERFTKAGIKAVVVNNYPLLSEYESLEPRAKKRQVAYAGYISDIRGIREMVSAMGSGDTKLALMGKFTSEALRAECQRLPGWKNVNELGSVDRATMNGHLAESAAGLVLFLPAPNHIAAQPNKLFEYMAMGLPVVASHFPLWRSIVEPNNCGICVDPSSVAEIAKAIATLVDAPDLAREMGGRGAKVVREKLNWEVEAAGLLGCYRELMEGSRN